MQSGIVAADTASRLPDRMVDQLILTAEAVVRYRIATYRNRFKLTELQYRMMMHVEQHAPISVGELAALVGRDIAQVSRTVKALVDTGLMVCKRTPGKIAKSLCLSPKGNAVYLEMAAVGEDWDHAISRALPSEDLVHAVHVMKRLNEEAHRIMGRGDDAGQPAVAYPRRDRRFHGSSQRSPSCWPASGVTP